MSCQKCGAACKGKLCQAHERLRRQERSGTPAEVMERRQAIEEGEDDE